MSAQQNAETAQALNDAFNAKDFDAAAALTAPDAVFVNVATGETFTGPDGARAFLQVWATAFPDAQVETTMLVADEEAGALEFVGRGTQTGPLQSPLGTIPPTGRAVETRFAQMLEFSGGKIARARLYFDVGGLLQQLGMTPAAGPAVGAPAK